MGAHRVTVVGPPATALRAVTALAEADGVDLTSSKPPAPDKHGAVTLDVTVDGELSDVSAAVDRIRGDLPDDVVVELFADDDA